jgi:DNA-binding LacI/PurR family transcriptional regulator
MVTRTKKRRTLRLMAAIDELVRRSGYSRSTVFRYLAGKQVRPAAREAIVAAMRESGHAPVKDRSEFSILVSLPPDFEGFRGYADAVEGIMRRAAESGIPVVFHEPQIEGRRFGAIILGKSMNDEDTERSERTAAGVPCVLLNRIVDEDDASWVSVDFRAAAAEAAHRLRAAGCLRLACWADADNRRVERSKIEGLQRAAAAAGITVLFLSPEDGDVETAAAAALRRSDRPNGWFAPSDEIAMRVIRVAVNLGLRVPGDLSVVSMNDVTGAAYFSPSITSIHVPFLECGAAAVDAVVRLLENPLERSVKILLRHRLVERESCASATRP